MKLIIRLILTVILLTFCWMGKTWAISLALTFIFVGIEINSLLFRKIIRHLNE